jgi:hypothetical protein
MHFGFNNQFIKVMRTWPKFQKFQKIILFSFNIRDYEFIRKTYSDIKNVVFLFDARTVRFYPIKIKTSLLRRAFLES